RGQRTSQRDTLVEGGDKKQPTSCCSKGGRHLSRAQAISVGLDNRGAASGFDPCRQHLPIPNNTPKINLKDGTRALAGIVGHDQGLAVTTPWASDRIRQGPRTLSSVPQSEA